MINRAFRYDLLSDKWIEIEDKNFIDTDIEKLPVTMLVKIYNSQSNKKYVFCPKHKKFEEIILADENVIISENYCKFTGLTAIVDFDHEYRDVVYVPFRWRIFQRTLESPINIAADVAFVTAARYGVLVSWKNFYINVSIAKKICVVKKIEGYRRYLENWTEYTEVQMPEIVTETAMEVLRESTKAIYGIKPTVTTNMQSVTKILAYIERPFDVNIILLKKFFAQFGDFDKIFPYECKDNYKIICKLLEINPPKSLRKAYVQNPYSIIWYMILKQCGVKDVNFMQKFFRFEHFLDCVDLKDFYFNPKDKILVNGENIYRASHKNWKKFEYYCKWLLENKGEKFFTNWLYRLVTEDELSNWQWDMLDMFHKNDKKLSDNLKVQFLKYGLTEFVHDAMSYEISEYLSKLQRVRIIYDKKIMAYEAEINGYKFRAVRDTKDLYYLGLEMSNCVMTYRDKVLSRQSIIFCVICKEKYVACIEIRNENEIVQALGYHNQLLEGELLFVCNFWAQLKNLKISTEQLNLPIKIIFGDVTVPKNLQNLICRIISD